MRARVIGLAAIAFALVTAGIAALTGVLEARLPVGIPPVLSPVDVLSPSPYSQWVYSGDILRFSFYVIILVGAARELNAYRHGLAQAAALEERRLIARDLHDGLAQELG